MSNEQVAPPGGASPTQWDGAGSTPAPALPPLPHVREVAPGHWRTFEASRTRVATEVEAALRQHFEHVCAERDRLTDQREHLVSVLRNVAAERDRLRVALGDLLHLGGPVSTDHDDIRHYLDAQQAAFDLLAREGMPDGEPLS